MRWLLIILLLVACRKETNDGYTTYVIEKGNHYCNGWKAELCDPSLKFNFIFDQSCKYDEDSVIPGVNKLYGFSNLSFEGNHDYSCRLGWKWSNKLGKIIVYWYAYTNGQRAYGELDTVSVMQQNYGKTELWHSIYIMQCNSHIKYLPCTQEGITYFKQFPYFGGQSVAPHRMIVLIKDC